MPEGLRERISVAARHNGRSMNAEIVTVLETHYPPEPTVEELLSMLQMFAGEEIAGRSRSRVQLRLTLEELRTKLEAERNP